MRFFKNKRKENKNIVFKIGSMPGFRDLNLKSGLLDFGDDLIAREIEDGNWENGSIAIWTHMIQKFKFDQIYDIGAYNGIFGLIASEKSSSNPKIRFIEGNPFVYSRLIANLQLNGISTAKASWTALSDQNSPYIDMHLRLSPSNLTTGGSVLSVHQDKRYEVRVPNENFEHFLKKLKGTLLAKIDIEGSEMALLEGLLPLYKDATLVILLEVLTEKQFKDVVKLASKFDYSIFPIDEESRRLGPLFSFNQGRRNRNYIVCSNKGLKIINAIQK